MVEYTYDAWGRNTCIDNTTVNLGTLNPFRYRGYYFDTEIGLYYLKTRYYDPAIGRFISIDGIEYLDPETVNGLNLYAYCNNNPVMNIDPNGTWSWKKFWRTVGAVAVAAVTVVAVTVATVVTAGAAAVALGATATVVNAVMVGAAVGGLVAGSMSTLGQGLSNGFHNLNIVGIAIDTFSGAAFSAITAGIGAVGTTTAKIWGGAGKVLLSGFVAMLDGTNRGYNPSDLFSNAGASMLKAALLQTIFVGGGAMFGNVEVSKSGNNFIGLMKNIFTSINSDVLLKVGITEQFKGIWRFLRGQYKY